MPPPACLQMGTETALCHRDHVQGTTQQCQDGLIGPWAVLPPGAPHSEGLVPTHCSAVTILGSGIILTRGPAFSVCATTSPTPPRLHHGCLWRFFQAAGLSPAGGKPCGECGVLLSHGLWKDLPNFVVYRHVYYPMVLEVTCLTWVFWAKVKCQQLVLFLAAPGENVFPHFCSLWRHCVPGLLAPLPSSKPRGAAL